MKFSRYLYESSIHLYVLIEKKNVLASQILPQNKMILRCLAPSQHAVEKQGGLSLGSWEEGLAKAVALLLSIYH